GAAAAFLGLEVSESGSDHLGQWEAIAVGDTCVVQVRGDELIETFPLASSAEFSNRPLLISSVGSPEEWLSQLCVAKGQLDCDDSLLVMTDALAAWFMAAAERGGRPWAALRDMGTADGHRFDEYIESLRQLHELKNDDVTLVRIDVVG